MWVGKACVLCCERWVVVSVSDRLSDWIVGVGSTVWVEEVVVRCGVVVDGGARRRGQGMPVGRWWLGVLHSKVWQRDGRGEDHS